MKNVPSAWAFIAVLIGGPALAADLPSMKAPPPYYPPVPIQNWSGFYVGINAGGIFGGSQGVTTSAYDLYDAPGFAPGAAFATSAGGWGPVSNAGFIGGGQIGYNWQLNNSFVAGIETDLQGTSSSHSSSLVGYGFDPLSGASPVTTTSVQKSLDYLGTVRARVGYLPTPTILLYATGGLAYGGVNLQSSLASNDAASIYAPGFGSSSFTDTRVGWTVGAGGEWMFAHNWSAKLEYMYYNLGSVSTPATAVAGLNAGGAATWAYAPSASARYDGHVIRAGLNYHFNWGGAPILAKY
jgi:outer membrane immunogenic protein